MSKFKPFFGGIAFGNLLILNHVYQNEMIKQQMRNELETLKKIRDYVS